MNTYINLTFTQDINQHQQDFYCRVSNWKQSETYNSHNAMQHIWNTGTITQLDFVG